MMLRERLLLSLSVPVGGPAVSPHKTDLSLEESLALLEKVYPTLADLVSHRRVLDFGCGSGLQSIALAQRFGCDVTGLDTNTRTLAAAQKNANERVVDNGSLTFASELSPEHTDHFDVVIAKDSFEHFDDPEGALTTMTSAVKPGGVVLITFGPPWLAPYGSHMHFFCSVPWVNVLFPERVVMRVRANYRDDGAMHYEDVESGLNKMTIARFESIVRACNLAVLEQRYDCVKDWRWLGKIPGLREFLINHVTVVLRRPL